MLLLQADVAAGAEQGMPAAQAIDSMGTVVSAVLAPVEPAAAALQTEGVVQPLPDSVSCQLQLYA